MSTPGTWKEKLAGSIPEEIGREIDIFETQMHLRQQGKLDEKIFAESRLRRGVYGQRYDNGQRFDGAQIQQLRFPNGELTKGPETLWDAPGMVRIKIPFGGINTAQMEVLADLAEEYSDDILHVTTRQDFQLHFVHIEDTPDLMRRLAAVGITTREACGNSVRNVTACPLSGVCRTEAFDTTPYAHGLAMFLLGHPDTQDFGRKFKIAFSGCKHEACGLTSMHDLGAIAVEKEDPGLFEQRDMPEKKRGFELYVGGGLGPVPYQAQLFSDFVPAEELLPISQAISRVFARLGEKKNRNRARLKFLVANLGIEEFRRLVAEERAILPHDPRWTAYLDDLHRHDEQALKPAQALNGAMVPAGFAEWRRTNVYAQRQTGYAVVTVALPLGDLTPGQMRGLAELARRHVRDTVRITVDQNLVLRWVSEADLPAVYAGLAELGLANPGAGTIVDITSCPGTDTCKLGIASSRGLAAELRQRLAENQLFHDEAIEKLHIKISGCFNSCGQHHVADIGFYGNSRKMGGLHVPHFQVVLGGQWTENAGSFGLAVGAVPSKRIPEVVTRLASRYLQDRQQGESFQAFIQRIGKKAIKELLEEFTQVPAFTDDPSLYRDWGDTRVFTMGDLGIGECAGEVVPQVNFELSGCEREAFEAQLHLEAGDHRLAYQAAVSAMTHAAKALVKSQFQDVPEDSAVIVAEFRHRFFDPEFHFDRFSKSIFAHLIRAHEQPLAAPTRDQAHQHIEEAQLVIEAAYTLYDRMAAAAGVPS